jgi:poly(3-hydroxybutyrate) depolymerase
MAQVDPDPETVYLSGKTPLVASRHDQRLSYCLYVPAAHDPAGAPLPLVVLQHGTARTAMRYRDEYAEWAEQVGCVLLAPLYPGGIEVPGDLHNFKFLKFGELRFDLELLAIVDEVAERYNVTADQFYLHGFSGGGQFAHRFFLLHPDRLAGISIGAPGRITRLDDTRMWWLGTKDVAEIFGAPVDLAAMRDVPVQLVVGAADVETWEINNPGGANWMDGAELAGRTRIERLRTLRRDYLDNGLTVRFDLVPGVAHSGSKIRPVAQAFLAALFRGEDWRQPQYPDHEA